MKQKPKTKPIRARKMPPAVTLWADSRSLYSTYWCGLCKRRPSKCWDQRVLVLPDDAASRKARLEAAAMAIYEGWRKWTQVCDVPAPWSKSVSPYKESAYRHARAALAAERGR